jgi:type VI protein secretion system component Hcp
MLRRFSTHIARAAALSLVLLARAESADIYSQDTEAQRTLNGFIDKTSVGGSTDVAFLKLDDVRGSSTTATNPNEIPVLFARNFISLAPGASGTTAVGRAVPADYFLAIPVDVSTPVLAQAAASGKSFQRAQITFWRPDKGELRIYSVVILTDVLVSYYLSTSTPVHANPHVAIIGLRFGTAEWSVGTTKAGYDFRSAKNL